MFEIPVIYMCVREGREVELYYQQGWELGYISRGYWGLAFWMKHEEM